MTARPDASGTEATRRNLELLFQLRWLAVAGQLATILAVRFLLGVALPLAAMLTVLAVLAIANLLAPRTRRWATVSEATLLATLLIDVACLTAQLALSGGAENPFVSLYLLQVVLGAVLLQPGLSWVLVALTSLGFAGLALAGRPLALPVGIRSSLSPSFVFASWFGYTLTAALLVAFATRIARNLRDRDARLADLQRRAAEEEQIVRMGLLASGAAHELGTPLASLSVVLGDWHSDARIAGDPGLAEEVADMQAEVQRCKRIVAGILFAAGEAAGEAPVHTTLARFVADALATAAPGVRDLVRVADETGRDVAIVADRALAQTLLALVDNAAEAGAHAVAVTLANDRAEDAAEDAAGGGGVAIAIADDGAGFRPDILASLGRPYTSTKPRPGAGLGLFLASNVLRTLGGRLEAANRPGGGAEVVLRLPARTLLDADSDDGAAG